LYNGNSGDWLEDILINQGCLAANYSGNPLESAGLYSKYFQGIVQPPI